MLNVLALDTSASFSSASVVRADGAQFSVEDQQQRQHSRSILALVDEVLSAAQLQKQALDLLAVTIGPGSFTGLRIGVAVAQGLAFSLGCRVVPVSSLLLMAYKAKQQYPEAQYALATLDARMQQVYAAWFELIGDGVPKLLEREQVLAPDALPLLSESHSVQGYSIAVGSGCESFERWPTQLKEQLQQTETAIMPNASTLAEMVTAHADLLSQLSALQLRPVYIRDNVAS